MAFNLDFDLTIEGAEFVDKIPLIMEKIAAEGKLTEAQMKKVEAALVSAADAGRSLSDGLNDISSNTAKANQTIAAYASSLRQATQEAIKLEQELNDLRLRQQQVENAEDVAERRREARAKAEEDRIRRVQEARDRAGKQALYGLAIGSGAANYGQFQLAGGVASAAEYGGTSVGIAAGAVTGVALLTAGLTALIVKEAEAVRQTQNFADRLDISAASAYKLQAAAKIVSVDVNTLTQAGRFLATALEDPAGAGKKVADALDRVGISTHQLTGELKPVGEVVLDVLQVLSQIPDRTERIREAQVLLGRGSRELLPLIENYQQLRETVDRLGISLSDVSRDSLEEANKKFKELEETVKNLLVRLAARIAPIVIPVVVAITESAVPSNSESENFKNPRRGRPGTSASYDPNSPSFDPSLGPRPPVISAAEAERRGLAGADDYIAQAASATSYRDAHRATTVDGLEAQVKEVKTKIGLDNSTASDPHTSLTAQATARAAVASDEKELAQLEAKLKALRGEAGEAAKELRQFNEAVKEVKKFIDEKGRNVRPDFLGRIDNVNKDRETELNSDRIKLIEKRNPEQAAELEQAINIVMNHRIAEIKSQEADRNRQQFNHFLDESGKDVGVENRHLAATMQHDNLEVTRGGLSDFRKADEETRSQDQPIIQSIREAGEQRARLAVASAGQGDELHALIQANEERRKAAEQELILKNIHYQAYDIEKERAEFDKENQKAQFDLAVAVTEERKKQRDQFSGGFASSIEGLKNGKGGAAFVESFVKPIETTALRNIGGEIFDKNASKFQLPGQGTSDNPTLLGRVFRGTSIGLDPTKSPEAVAAIEATKNNTSSQGLLTKAVDNLRTAVVASAGGNDSGDPTSIPSPENIASGDASQTNPIAAIARYVGSSGTASAGIAATLASAGGTSAFRQGVTTPQNALQTALSLFSGGRGGSGRSTSGSDNIFDDQQDYSYGDSVSDTGFATFSSAPSLSGPGDYTNQFPSGVGGGFHPDYDISGTSSQPQNNSSGNPFTGLLPGGGGGSGKGGGPLAGSVEGPLFDSNAGTADRIGSGVATAAVVYGGVQGIIGGINKGGAYGTLGAIGAGAGAAAALDPEPISKAVLTTVALVSKGIQLIIGDPRQAEADRERKEIGNAKYEAPIALNTTQGMNGTYTDYDQFGVARSSKLSATPQVIQSQQYYRGGVFEQQPGSVTSPFGGPSMGGTPTVQIMFAPTVQTLDQTGVSAVMPSLVNGLADHIAGGNGTNFINELNRRQGNTP